MNAEQIDELASALRSRFEADAIFGVRALPLTVSAMPARATVSRATTSSGIIATTAAPLVAVISADELATRTVNLQQIDESEVKPCIKCGLHATRNHTVFGVGSPAARIMFVGEAPGADEDASGEPFVGRAGQLLTDMIQKGMGLRREDVYICNVIKCRPPNNRTPATDELVACKGYLWRQIEIIKPEVIIALGAPAAQTLLNTREGIGRLRGRWHSFYASGSADFGEPIQLMATFHPAYLLRTPSEKSKAWEDLKMVMARLSIPLPTRQASNG